MSGIWTGFVNLLSQVLIWLTNLTGSLGIAIILFTMLARLVLLPLTIKQLQSSKKMQELQPKMAELKRKYGKDQRRFNEEMQRVYKENNANPAGGCLPLLIQMPIFLGVYRAVINLVSNHPELPHKFLWVADLSKSDPLFILPVLSVICQLLVSVMAMPKIQDPTQKATSQAMLIMPIMFGIFAFSFPAGAVLNWVAGAVLSMIQQFFVSGFGSLTNYLTFLPDRKGFLTPNPVAVTVTDDGEESVEPETPQPDFWTPLQKLQTSTAGSGSDATEQAIADAKQQGRGTKRR